MKAIELVETWRKHLRRRFPLHPHLVDAQVQKVWALRSTNKTLTPGDLQTLEKELLELSKREQARMNQSASEPALSTFGSPPGTGSSHRKRIADALPPNLIGLQRGVERPLSGTSRASSISRAQTTSSVSRIKFAPKMYYPKVPLQKPMDVWDHIVRFDLDKFQSQEKSKPFQDTAYRTMYKKQLDAQMDEINYKKQLTLTEKHKDLDTIISQHKLYEEDLERQRERKMQVKRKLIDEMNHSKKQRERADNRAKRQAQNERDALKQAMERDKEAEDMLKQIASERQLARNIERLDVQRTVRERKLQNKEDQKKEEKEYVERSCADADAKEAAKKALLNARIAKMAENSDGASKAVLSERAAKEAHEDARLRRDQEKYNRAVEERERNKKDTLDRLSKEMQDCLYDQINLKKQKKEIVREEMKIFGKKLDVQAEEKVRDDKQQIIDKRLKRKEFDIAVVDQVRSLNVIHPIHRIRRDLEPMEKDFNQPILRTMQSQGYLECPPHYDIPVCDGFKDRNIIPVYDGEIVDNF